MRPACHMPGRQGNVTFTVANPASRWMRTIPGVSARHLTVSSVTPTRNVRADALGTTTSATASVVRTGAIALPQRISRTLKWFVPAANPWSGGSATWGYTGSLMATPPQLEEGVWTTGPDGEVIPDYESTFPTITEGEVVHGTVVRVDKDEVLVDIGYKSEGVIPVAELSIRRSVNPADEVTLGDEIDALVLTKEDAEWRLILSKKRARFELAWKAIEGAAESGEPVNGRGIEVKYGNRNLDVGVRGFWQTSHVVNRRVQDLDEFRGHEL